MERDGFDAVDDDGCEVEDVEEVDGVEEVAEDGDEAALGGRRDEDDASSGDGMNSGCGVVHLSTPVSLAQKIEKHLYSPSPTTSLAALPSPDPSLPYPLPPSIPNNLKR